MRKHVKMGAAILKGGDLAPSRDQPKRGDLAPFGAEIEMLGGSELVTCSTSL